MLDAPLIRRLFKALNGELAKKGVIGEVGLCGGAVMCLEGAGQDQVFH